MFVRDYLRFFNFHWSFASFPMLKAILFRP